MCGVVGFFRPSFGLVPIIYIIWQKQQLTSVFHLNIDWMDHFTVIETGITLILGYLVYALGRRVYGEQIFNYPYSTGDKKLVSIHAIDLLVLTAIALHFGNYFYAGVIKLGLGLQHPLFWVLDNQTQYLMLAGLESAVLPISFSETLTAVSYGIMSNVKVLTNFVTISTQLLAVVAIARIRWAILITIAYDILHVTIFVLTGIFFWKFIILNLAIVAGLSTMRFGPIPRRLKVLLCAIVVCSPAVFQIMPSYAWLDGRTMNSVKVIAVTDDGQEFRVPSNYFLGTSVTFAQHRAVWPQRGPASTETWATTRNADVMRRSLNCEWGHSEGNLPLASWPIPKAQMTGFIQRHHQQILSLADERGFVEYDLFPHHIFSVPWEFTEFRALDKRRIVKYRYQNETICLNYENGQLKRDVMWSAGFDIPLAEAGAIR
ncbi:MAG: hypothetical protein MJE12_27620 [Alphaproteobacteria bacterium]|nr:hypothetical protein [Alphaproteobacteria bacterium]